MHFFGNAWPLDTEEQKNHFASDPAAYLSHRKAIETKINESFRNNIADHPNQKLAREVRPSIALASEGRINLLFRSV